MPKAAPRSITPAPARRGPGIPRARIGTVRPPLARISRIHKVILNGALPNCSTLAKELEVSRKTIQRDIDFMRDQMELPINYDDARHGFHYTKPVKVFPPVKVTQGEIVSILVAQKALEQYEHTPFHKTMAEAFAKLVDSFDESISVSWQSLGEAISFRPETIPSRELLHFQDLTTATLDRREVEFDYHKLGSNSATRRRVQPYHISCISNQWYLFGFDLVRGAIRTFNLIRISKLKTLKASFKRPETFSPDDLLKGSFSAFESTNPEKVEIHLTGTAARLILEKRIHESQKIRKKSGGAAILKLQVGLTPDLEAWLLSWGAEAVVIKPAPLRERIRESHAMALKAYR